MRSLDLGRCLDLFLVCAIASVIANRVFLIITGYPQLGNSTLHISHAIWGAFMMMIAIVASVSFVAPFTRTFAAFLGGCGFGWFIDELGKFITRDVNYFFKPTFAIMYMIFITMYLVFRTLERKRFTSDEAVLNGLESLKAASIGQLSEARRRESLAVFDRTRPEGPLGQQIRAMLANAPTSPPSAPGVLARITSRIRQRYVQFTEWRGFVPVVNLLFVALAAATVASSVSLSLDRHGLNSFAEKATVASASAVGVMFLIGVPLLPRDRLAAYRWFERGVLVSIFVVQIFVFAERELEGVLGLIENLFIWLLLRSAIRIERERELIESVQPS